MVAPDSGSEQIRYDILIEAKVAIATLREIYATMENNSEKVLDFSKVLIQSSQEWGLSIKETTAIFRQLNAEMAKKGGSIFGNTGGKDLITESEQVAQSYVDAGRAAQETAPQVDKLVEKTEKLTTSLKNGTATVKEYSKALLQQKDSGYEALSKQLSGKSIYSMSVIQPGEVNSKVVSQVATVMREIQGITKQSTDRVRQMMRTMFPNIDTKNLDLAAQKIQNFPSKISKAFRDIGNVIKGTLTAMLVFNLQQAITKLFQDSYDLAAKFRAQMVQLNFAESILSQKGMEITREELDKIIANIKEGAKYLSTLEVSSIVGEVANMAAEFGITKDQMAGVSAGIAFMNLQAKVLGKEGVDAGSTLNALGDMRSNFFNAYGINITKQAVQEKAIKMNLIEQGQELDKNTARQAAYALFIEQTAGKQDEFLASIRQTNPELAKSLELQMSMEDVKLTLGDQLLSLKAGWDEFILGLGGFEDATQGAKIFGDALKFVAYILAAIWKVAMTIVGIVSGAIAGVITGIGETIILANQLIHADFKGAWATWKNGGKEVGKALWEGVKAGWELGGDPFVFLDQITDPSVAGLTNTPTSPELPPIVEDQVELQKALEKMNEEILQSQLKLEQDMREVAIDLGRAMVDITKEYAQKRADAERDYANKISDINRNYAEKIASIEAAQWEARQQARVDEEQREREFQNKMQELKEKFLMDLDDALHERNARQILKLIKQYNLDKTQMERQHAIEEQNARETERIQQESFERQKQAAQEARDRELEDAQIDFERKMEELKIQEDREVEAAVLKANRKLQDLERENLDRNTLIAAGLVNDFNLTQSMLGQIDQLFTDHYGYVTGVYQAMMAMLSQPIQLGAVTTSGTTTGTLPPAGGIGGTENPGMGGSNASSDMRSKFGGLSKLPIISRTKMDTNKVFSGMGGNGRSGRDGALTIDLTLSPDLEARVVKNTMDKTADVITRVRRTK